MTRHATILLALVALLCGALAGSAVAAGPVAHDAAKKTRAQKLKTCLKKAKKQPTAAARRKAAKRCRARFGPRKKGGSGGGQVAEQNPQTQTPPPSVEPVRDDAKFRAAVTGRGLYRQYAVPKPNHGIGFNYHDEVYAFCPTLAVHSYEGIAYIYKSGGPWEVVEGFVNGDNTRGYGTIRYTQASANFTEEVGKVLDIRIDWSGAAATVVHPEIGTNQFEVVPNAPCS